MQKLLLLIVAFLSGAILMALELVGSRVLAPHFGNSIFVWGSLIGSFLAAMSIGYYFGGKAADRWPHPRVLAGVLALGGLFIIVLALPGQRGEDMREIAWVLCDWIAVRDLGQRSSPLIACMILFFLPGMIMGTTSPFVVRLTAQSIERVGETAGIVYAISTIGSIAGTIGASFYLIQMLGTRSLLYLLGAALLFTAVIALVTRAARTTNAAVLSLLALSMLFQPAQAESRTLLERDSPYHRLFVRDEDGYRYLRADAIIHTQMNLNNPWGRGLPYTDYIDLAFLFNPEIRSVLVIGLGGGTIPKRFLRDYSQVKVEVVEIDPDVIEIAARYFEVEPSDRLKIHESDGRIFLRRSKAKFDLIVLDAYYQDSVPFFLTTKEFFRIVSSHLTPKGIFVNNVVSALRGKNSKFFRSVYRTTKEVFPQVWAIKVAETGPAIMNIEVFAMKTKTQIEKKTLRERALQAKGTTIKDDRIVWRLNNLVTSNIRTDNVLTLTDDYAPVDALLHLW